MPFKRQSFIAKDRNNFALTRIYSHQATAKISKPSRQPDKFRSEQNFLAIFRIFTLTRINWEAREVPPLRLEIQSLACCWLHHGPVASREGFEPSFCGFVIRRLVRFGHRDDAGCFGWIRTTDPAVIGRPLCRTELRSTGVSGESRTPLIPGCSRVPVTVQPRSRCLAPPTRIELATSGLTSRRSPH